MIGFRQSVESAKRAFFDRQKVLSATDRATRRTLSKAGAFVRRTAKGLIRKRKKSSQPGQPPSSHSGLLKRLLFFSYEALRQSVVIGPAKLNQLSVDQQGGFVKGTVPEVLEYGGTVGILEVFKWGFWRRADLRSRRRNAGLKTRIRRVHIDRRPYMGPALKKEKTNFPTLFHDSIRQAA